MTSVSLDASNMAQPGLNAKQLNADSAVLRMRSLKVVVEAQQKEAAATRAWRAQKLQQCREAEQDDRDAAFDRYQRNAGLMAELSESDGIHETLLLPSVTPSGASNIAPGASGVFVQPEGDRAGGGAAQEEHRGVKRKNMSQHAADDHVATEKPRRAGAGYHEIQADTSSRGKRGDPVVHPDLIESRKRMAEFDEMISRLASSPSTADGSELPLVRDTDRRQTADSPLPMDIDPDSSLVERRPESLETGSNGRAASREGGGSCEVFLELHNVSYVKPLPASGVQVTTNALIQGVSRPQDVGSWCSLVEKVPLSNMSVQRSCKWIADSVRVIQEL